MTKDNKRIVETYSYRYQKTFLTELIGIGWQMKHRDICEVIGIAH